MDYRGAKEKVITAAIQLANYPAFDPKFIVPYGFWRDVNALEDAVREYELALEAHADVRVPGKDEAAGPTPASGSISPS